MSDQKQLMDLTAEEQEAIRVNAPTMLEALEKGGSVAKAWLKSWRAQGGSMQAEAEAQAKDIRGEVAKQQPEQSSFLGWFGFPTDLTRCSPFFPMRHNELGERKFLRDFLITAAGWGEIRYTGPQLTTYEEDALMVVLAILDVANHRETTETEGRKTYTYRGPALPLLRMLGYERPNVKDRKRLVGALELLTVAGVKLFVAAGKTKKGKQRAPRQTYMSAMLAGAAWNEEKKELSVTVNPFFYEAFFAGTVTFIDVSKRIAIKGVVAKALYRFVQSHRKNIVFEGHFLTLADTLNIDREQPAFELRRLIKRSIAELIRQNVLTKKSKFVSQDIVLLERSLEALPEPKKVCKK
jgi:hypothetical protein